jgi:hypothetical protein
VCVGEGEGSRPVQRIKSIETIDGWPLLTVETEVNGESKSTHERGPPLVDFCSASVALVGPVQNIFFFTVYCFNSFVTSAQQAGLAAVLGRLSLSVCLWLGVMEKYIYLKQ